MRGSDSAGASSGTIRHSSLPCSSPSSWCCTQTTGTPSSRAFSTRLPTFATTASRSWAPSTTPCCTSTTSSAVFGLSGSVVIRSSLERGEGGEELPRGGDARVEVADEHPLVRRVDVRSGEREAADDRRDAAVREGRHDRKRAAAPDEQGADAEGPLERLLPEPERERVRRKAAGRGAVPLDVEPRARRRRLAQQPLRRLADRLHVLPVGEADRELRARLGGDRRVPQARLAADDPVHVERRLRPRAHVELVG